MATPYNQGQALCSVCSAGGRTEDLACLSHTAAQKRQNQISGDLESMILRDQKQLKGRQLLCGVWIPGWESASGVGRRWVSLLGCFNFSHIIYPSPSAPCLPQAIKAPSSSGTSLPLPSQHCPSGDAGEAGEASEVPNARLLLSFSEMDSDSVPLASLLPHPGPSCASSLPPFPAP